MIHIVFQQADIEALQKSFALDKSLEGPIVEIKDDFAIGPLKDIYSDEGIEVRKQWWREVLAGGDYDGLVDNGNIDDTKTVAALISTLQKDPEALAWIWAAQNKHDVSGYYWLAGQLSNFQGRIYILYLNNLPFINEKGSIFYPLNLFDIPPKEFLKARKLARLITPSEFENDTDEWKKTCAENKGVRILEGGKKLIQYNYDFYDNELLNLLSTDWVKVHKFIHGYLSKAKHTTGDAYLLWRLKQLIESGKLEALGEIKKMKDFEIKLKASNAEYTS